MIGDISKLNFMSPSIGADTSAREVLPRTDKKSAEKATPNPDQPSFKKELARKESIKTNRDDSEKFEKEDKVVPYESTGQTGKINSNKVPKAESAEVLDKPVNAIQEKTLDVEKAKNLAGLTQEQKSIAKFMAFMKDQYGVEPEQLVLALNDLSTDELLASPEESMHSFFKNLGLSDEDMGVAKEEYLGMLSELNAAQQAPVEIKPNISVEIIDPKKQRVADVNRRLDQMNASFFMNPPIEKTTEATGPALGEMNATQIDSGAEIQDTFFIKPKSNDVLNVQTTDNIKKGAIASDNIVQTESPSSGKIDLQQMGLDTFAESEVASSDLTQLDSPTLTESTSAKENLSKLAEISNKISALESGFDQSPNMSNENTGEENFNDSMGGQFNSSGVITDKQVDPNVSGTFAAELKAGDRGAKTESNNIQQLINQAQVMIRKGGGEMKVQLSPEGLGNVNLKVKVEDGKVGIQMIADTADAKRLLESSINDLKANLSQHKLSVDAFKVDVSDKFSDNMNQQSDLNREEARNFLGQFREQNQSFRGNMFGESPGLRAYRTYGGKEPSSKPVDPSVNSRRNDNGRIHLVA